MADHGAKWQAMNYVIIANNTDHIRQQEIAL